MTKLTEYQEMFNTTVYRMVNGVLPDNYGQLDVEIETGRQREYLKSLIAEAIAEHDDGKTLELPTPYHQEGGEG